MAWNFIDSSIFNHLWTFREYNYPSLIAPIADTNKFEKLYYKFTTFESNAYTYPMML